LEKVFKAHNLREVKHGFFGRVGGSSKGIYSSLNVSFNSADKRQNIIKNREIISKNLGTNSEKVFFLNQQHTNEVIFFDSKVNVNDINKIEADAFITDRKDTGIGILTADCAPILAYESESGFIAGIHAGWKGALAGICENTILKLKETGMDIKKLAVAIGPCISQENYEVKEDMVGKFLKQDPSFENSFNRVGKKIFFDLAGFIKIRFEEMGIYNIEVIDMCTYSDSQLFFSNRRKHKMREKDFGRMASVISL
tara:strand:+ start:1269 stop:2030 length:762 start_codon:yes stop_codon:yes gene_type:complete